MGYFDKFKRAGIPFMEGREKGNLSNMLDKELHIIDYGYLHSEDGDYAVMLFAEDDERFYFGNAIITDMLRTIDADDMKDELAAQPVRFVQRQAKNGKRTYTTYEF